MNQRYDSRMFREGYEAVPPGHSGIYGVERGNYLLCQNI